MRAATSQPWNSPRSWSAKSAPACAPFAAEANAPVRARSRTGVRDTVGEGHCPCHATGPGRPTPSTRTVAFLVAPEGVEQAELTGPWQAVPEAGGTPRLLATAVGRIQAFNHLDRGDTFEVDELVDKVSPRDFDALVLPGGVAHPDAPTPRTPRRARRCRRRPSRRRRP
ncbi:hypothetical protein GXP74_29615 [Streptacidiphilus sp. P02-A3a]|nr:hypothetical protein GXP74_29615 [Streptacidiphilus sp. P02-A3a]